MDSSVTPFGGKEVKSRVESLRPRALAFVFSHCWAIQTKLVTINDAVVRVWRLVCSPPPTTNFQQNELIN